MGSDKASLPLGNESMLQRIVRTLGSIVSPVVVVAAEGQALPDLWDDVFVARDEFPDRGPLEGIRVGLQNLPAGRSYAFISGCDAPLLQRTFIATLLAMRSGYDVIVPRQGNFHYPLFERVRTRTVDSSELRVVDPQLDSLRNLNTPQDYEEVARALRLS
jgi:molybdopterin-guanine dinucleotide biosynthesis protein A